MSAREAEAFALQNRFDDGVASLFDCQEVLLVFEFGKAIIPIPHDGTPR